MSRRWHVVQLTTPHCERGGAFVIAMRGRKAISLGWLIGVVVLLGLAIKPDRARAVVIQFDGGAFLTTGGNNQAGRTILPFGPQAPSGLGWTTSAGNVILDIVPGQAARLQLVGQQNADGTFAPFQIFRRNSPRFLPYHVSITFATEKPPTAGSINPPITGSPLLDHADISGQVSGSNVASLATGIVMTASVDGRNFATLGPTTPLNAQTPAAFALATNPDVVDSIGMGSGLRGDINFDFLDPGTLGTLGGDTVSINQAVVSIYPEPRPLATAGAGLLAIALLGGTRWRRALKQ